MMLLPPQPIVHGVSAPATPAARVSVPMEGKSLFTCHQCGALLKFKYSPVTIEEKIARLRSLDFGGSPQDHQQQQQEEEGEQLSSDAEDSVVMSSSVSSENGGGAIVAHPISEGVMQTPAVVTEYVWENQRLGDDLQWLADALLPDDRVAPFFSCNRGNTGPTIDDVMPTRLMNKAYVWVSDWEVDHSLAQSDDDGWTYAGSFKDLEASANSSEDGAPQECVVRRRRFLRKRQIDGSDLSWFQELLDCSSLLLKRKTPTCHDCEIATLHTLQQTLNELTADREQYEAFLEQFGDEQDLGLTDVKYADEEGDNGEWYSASDDPELRALEEEERWLQAEYESLEAETQQVIVKRNELWATGADLEQLIHGTFAEGAFLQHLLGLSRDERQSVGVFSVHASDMLRRLQRYNVYNDVFHIWHDGLFGTINGLRLGRLPSKPVEWVEINAALGQAVLLLATIAERANFEFTRNKLIPRGSFSRVVNMYSKEYSLYSDGGMFRRRGFNQAMILFLECVDDAGKRAMKEEPSLTFPYKIQRGKIGDLPISLGNDEQWTKALKYMLTHLKWLLAWISKRYP